MLLAELRAPERIAHGALDRLRKRPEIVPTGSDRVKRGAAIMASATRLGFHTSPSLTKRAQATALGAVETRRFSMIVSSLPINRAKISAERSRDRKRPATYA
jgi:hypothetical protein